MIGSNKWFLAALLALGVLPAAASAQTPFLYGFGGNAGYGQGYDNRVQPYFALHSPVYYSQQIVRRPIGPSPYAYPGWMQPTCGAQMGGDASYGAGPGAPAPQWIANPFVKTAKPPAPAVNPDEEKKDLSAPAPLDVSHPAPQRILNPHVASRR